MILITRPIDKSIELSERLEDMGYKCLIEPMLKVTTIDAEIPHAEIYLTTSRNALESIPYGANSISIPEYGKNGKEILKYIRNNISPYDGKIVYLRGSKITLDFVAELKAENYEIEEVIVYSSEPVKEFSRKFAESLSNVTVATFFSSETYRNFLQLCEKNNLIDKLKQIDALLISEKLASVAPNYWANAYVAGNPNLDSMVEGIEEITSI